MSDIETMISLIIESFENLNSRLKGETPAKSLAKIQTEILQKAKSIKTTIDKVNCKKQEKVYNFNAKYDSGTIGIEIPECASSKKMFKKEKKAKDTIIKCEFIPNDETIKVLTNTSAASKVKKIISEYIRGLVYIICNYDIDIKEAIEIIFKNNRKSRFIKYRGL